MFHYNLSKIYVLKISLKLELETHRFMYVFINHKLVPKAINKLYEYKIIFTKFENRKIFWPNLGFIHYIFIL